MPHEIFKRECEEVKRLGEQIGYGNMMDIASALWAKELIDNECGDSGAFYPTVESQMIDGEIKEWAIDHRQKLIQLFDEWGW